MKKDHTHGLEYLKSRLIYNAETGVFTWLLRPIESGRRRRHSLSWNTRYAGKPAGRTALNGYVVILVDKRWYLAHRLAWMFEYGRWPKEDIDHINRDRADNRIANLRGATRTQNNGNTKLHRHNTSGVKGVCWATREKRWLAQVQFNGKCKSGGRFKSFDEACAARRKLAANLFGDFASDSPR